MNYAALYREAESRLGSPFEASQLFAHVTNKRVVHLSFLGQREAPEKDVALLYKLCDRRRQGEPLQYLLGEWEFYGLPFKVGKGVLIPRQDTETLVDAALELLRDVPSPELLDLCSGSGCVAVSIGHERPDARITALELSDHAYGYLVQNVQLNGSRVQPVRCDLREYLHPRPLDALVANPPYIPRDVIASLQTEVQHEPRRALDGGVDGLDFYRAIVRLYHPQLRPGGIICMEVGKGQSGRVCSILADEGYEQPGEYKDYNGISRVVYARKATETCTDKAGA